MGDDYLKQMIIINNVEVPVEKEKNMIWYPISYFGSKVLLKSLSGNQLINNGYEMYIKQFKIDFGMCSGGLQDTYCINEKGLKIILKNSNITRLSTEQKKAMKEVCNYFNIKIDINLAEKFINNISESEWENYNFWEKECIQVLLKEMPDIIWQKCSKCNKYYPYHECFWDKERNKRNKQPLKTVCNNCNGLYINYYNNKDFTKAYYEGGEILYNVYKYENKNIYKIYELYLNDKIKYPSILMNSINTTNIIIKFYKNRILENINEFNMDFISDISKIPKVYISAKSLDRFMFSKLKKEEILKSNIENNTTKIRSKTGKNIINKMTFEDAINLINIYLEMNNIIIDDVYNFDYNTLFKESKTYWYVINIEKDKLGFIMKYFNNQYAAYKFKSVIGKKYWFNRDNADQAMKYFIEEDIKIPIEKIPLYVTKNNLQIKARTLYNILHKKRFDDNLFQWIDRIYPNKFIEEDFNVAIIRNEFDSMEEKMIHDMLKSEFKNVIYNNRNTENKITIMGMNPDWLIFTDNNVYIVEYFGISIDTNKYNSRIVDYTKKTGVKINKYKELPYGTKIYLFPEDIKNDCEGFKEKTKIIV